MNESNENFYLTTAPIKKLLMKFSIPCVLSMLVSALYNIVDQIFIGNSSAGTAGIMATTLVFPFTVVALAISQLIGDGCATLFSISLGAKDEETAKMVEYAISKGINYFDTAWGYHNGESEIVMGKILKKYPRESFYLATKFPGYDLANMDKVEEIFEKQLEKCQVDYFDFYLFHNVYEKNIDPYLDPKYGILDYLLKQKEKGRIKHLGFSVHGSLEVMKKFLEAYGKYMEFCQIQLNYLDYKFQDAKAKVEVLNEYHIPIWVMEPLRGGKLAKLNEQEEKQLKNLRSDEEIPAWAFRFLQSIPGVTMVLSGMSTMEQLEKNIKTFEENKPLNQNEMQTLLGIADAMLKGNILPCTSCRYCTAHCPKGIDIPRILALYNEHVFTGGGFIAPMAISALPDDKKPSACIGCKSCEAVCPQQLKIAEAMTNFANLLK